MQSNPFDHLNFERQTRFRPSPRLLFFAGSVLVYLLVWQFLPAATLFWLGLPITIGLIWTASFGWRTALSELTRFLQRLESF